jgi:alpha-mannosidase
MRPTSIFVVPHTHWDREWYAPFDEFLERLVEMMDTLIEVLDSEPGFSHFHLDGQAAMIDDYLAVRPEREPDVRRLARAGRISVGPWFTQMDEFLVSGESLVRNLEWGIARARDLAGRMPPAGYLPDQFGHIGQMPQILRGAGIERAVVWRGVPASIDKTAFWWDSPDGSRVLAEYLAHGYFVGWWLSQSKDAEELSGHLAGAVQQLESMSARDRLLVTVGSDHHVPAAKLPPLLEEVNLTAEVPARMASLADYLDAPDPVDIPVWRGELRSAARAHLLPGVYSNRAHQKVERARVEALLERYAEPLSALVPGFEWPAEELEEAWRLLLWNGAHDSVCGCSVDQVAKDVDARHARARELAQGVIDRAMAALASQVGSQGRLLFNPSPFEREGVPGLGWGIRRDDQGQGEVQVDLRVSAGRIQLGGMTLRLVDEDDIGDLYTFCPNAEALPSEPTSLLVREGTIRGRFPQLQFRMRAFRRPGEPFVRLDVWVGNHRPDHRLRLHVGLPAPSDGSTAVAPFELVDRPLESEGGTEVPSPTWPARGAVLASGVAVLGPGVFEYEVYRGNELAVTLLRCVGTISRPEISTRGWAAGPDIATPDAQMIGVTPIQLAIHPGATKADLLPAWDRFALPLIEAEAPGGGSLPDSGSLLEVSGAEVSSVRKVDDAVQVRIWNASSEPCVARVAGRDVTLGPARIETVALG